MNKGEMNIQDELFCLKLENETLAAWLTGEHFERWVPGYVPKRIHNHHKTRYDLACTYVENKKVLDIACGCGYGSFLLADAGNAQSVLGVDIDSNATRYGNHRFFHERIHRVQGDALHFNGDNEFDVIVSFETIEHLPDVHQFLKNTKGLLKPGGVFLVSTPIVLSTSTLCDNPYHMIEWGFADFQQLIKKYFFVEDIYIQNVVLKTGTENAHPGLFRRGINKIKRSILGNPRPLQKQSPDIEKWNGQYPAGEMMGGYQLLVCRNTLS